MALGSPMGTSGSVCYGMVTSVGAVVDQADAAYKTIVTDIYGSSNATGVLINMDGMVIGIIDNVLSSGDKGNLLTAYGISELKRTIEKMSNDKKRAYTARTYPGRSGRNLIFPKACMSGKWRWIRPRWRQVSRTATWSYA